MCPHAHKQKWPASSVVIENPCLKRSMPIFDNRLNLNAAPIVMMASVKTCVQAEESPSEGPNLRVSAGEQV